MKHRVTSSLNLILDALSDGEYRTTKEIMSITGLSQPGVYRTLQILRYRDQIEMRKRPNGIFDWVREYGRIT